jgi:hypothetical protein
MVSKRKIPKPPPGIEPRSSDRLAHSQSLYRLSYHGSHSIGGYNFETYSSGITEDRNVKRVSNDSLYCKFSMCATFTTWQML